MFVFSLLPYAKYNKYKPKMLRGAPEYMLQMPAVRLKAQLNVVSKVVDNAYIFLLGDRSNLHSDGCPQN